MSLIRLFVGGGGGVFYSTLFLLDGRMNVRDIPKRNNSKRTYSVVVLCWAVLCCVVLNGFLFCNSSFFVSPEFSKAF